MMGRVFAFVVLFAGAGCGFLDQPAKVSFSVPAKEFQILGDVVKQQLGLAAGDCVPSDQDVAIPLTEEVSLAEEVPELGGALTLEDVTISSVAFDQLENEFSVDFAAVDVYVGAVGVQQPTDATRLGSIEPPPLHGEPTRAGELAVTEAGQVVLASLMSDAGVPFGILVVPSLAFRGGTASGETCTGDWVPDSKERFVVQIHIAAEAAVVE